MTALRFLLPLVAISILVKDSQEEGVYPRVVVLPEGKDKILNVGESILFTCTFEAKENDDHTKAESLSWKDRYGTEIHHKPSMPAYTKKISGRLGRMLVLMIRGDMAIDGEMYICEAQYGDQTIEEKSVTIAVFSPPRWVNSDLEVSGTINQSLQIDCRASSAYDAGHVDVLFLFQNNTQLPKENNSRYQEHSKSVLSIEPLTMTDRNVTVRCTALEMRGKVVLQARKMVTIDVQFPPILTDSHMLKYGVVGQSATLPCQVLDSNPPVDSFTFARDSYPLQDNEKYKIEVELEKRLAKLTINDLTQDDFGEDRYFCNAKTNGGRFESKLMYSFKEAAPPSIPEVAFKESGSSSIVLSIAEVPFTAIVDNPPVTVFDVRLVPYENLRELNTSQKKEIFAKTLPRIMQKTNSDLYVLDKLNSGTTYALEVRAVNDAGQSEPFEGNATTLASTSSTVRPNQHAATIFATFFVLLWPVALDALRV